MSDFLVCVGERYIGAELLKLVKLPYGARAPEGESFDYAWGSVAVLRDRGSPKSNICRCDEGSFAWVGDLVLDEPQRIAGALLKRAGSLAAGDLTGVQGLVQDEAFEKLNGAFGALLLSEGGPSVITDPLGSVQVYVGRDRMERVTAFGTHPDLVALIADGQDEIDPVSVFEFLNAGTPCFPHTMHARVRELAPGRLHVVGKDGDQRKRIVEAAWWPFPQEFDRVPDERELVLSLGDAFKAAVRDRCGSGPVGVTLSGGLDSRLVMAVVPESVPCIGFTFLDVLNREARTARQVARCYGREWVPLFRDQEYIARTAMDTVKFIGCEGDWVNAHGLGFVDEISQYHPGVVLTGLLMNNNVKGFYAADVVRVGRWRGLLPPKYEVVPYDYASELKPFASEVFKDGLLESARSRRRAFLEGHPATTRQSVAEWLDGYPFSQASDNTAWVAERRLMPVRLPAMDRRLLDITCRIPMGVKAGGRLFNRMSKNLFGKGARIPDANDGVRPGSGHWWRLIQRGIRKVENNRREILQKAGVDLHVPTSWHDYQRYWRESGVLRRLLAEDGGNLRDFEGTVFRSSPRALSEDPELPWLYGFRLVQLAIWKSCLRKYQSEAKSSLTTNTPGHVAARGSLAQ